MKRRCLSRKALLDLALAGGKDSNIVKQEKGHLEHLKSCARCRDELEWTKEQMTGISGKELSR